MRFLLKKAFYKKRQNIILKTFYELCEYVSLTKVLRRVSNLFALAWINFSNFKIHIKSLEKIAQTKRSASLLLKFRFILNTVIPCDCLN